MKIINFTPHPSRQSRATFPSRGRQKGSTYGKGPGVRWTPLHFNAEAPTEPTGETAVITGTPQSPIDFVGRGKTYAVFIMRLLANVFKHGICFDELRG